MNTFERLPVLQTLLNDFSSAIREDITLVAVQHLLSSTGSLFDAIVSLGIKPNNIYLLGKIYSTHSETEKKLRSLGINIPQATHPAIPGTYAEALETDVKRLWHKVKENMSHNSLVIILDDGGYAIKNCPEEILNGYRVLGIEQTMSGIKLLNRNFKNLPVISVAGSAAKTIIEPPIVSEAVNIRLGNVIKELHPKRIGIIGYGNIGYAVAKQLSKFYDVEVFEKNESLLSHKLTNAHYSTDMNFVFDNCDVIVGATGEDISLHHYTKWLKEVDNDKTLISISSGDIEFNSLLRYANGQLSPVTSALQTLEINTLNGKKIKILRGGMVANFTGEADSSPSHIIQFTRGLLLAAIFQIFDKYDELKSQKGIIMLDPSLQKKVVTAWFKDQPQRNADYSDEVLEGFKNEDWIAQCSEGMQISIS